MLNKTAIEQYFKAEKKESLLFILIGTAAVCGALFILLTKRHAFYSGASVPMLCIGLLLLVVGYTVYKRCDADRIRNVYAFDMNPAELTGKELPRMQQVMRNFMYYRYAEMLLAVTGIALYLFFIRDIRHDFWRGFGASLFLMALIALVADMFAEKRGRVYLNGLKNMQR